MFDSSKDVGHGILVICFLIWFWDFSLRITIPTLMPAIKQSFLYSTAEAGFLISMVLLGTALAYYPSGVAVSKIGSKRMIHCSILLVVVSMLTFTFMDNIHLMALTLFSAGVGLGAYLPAGLNLLASSYPISKRGFILGLHEAAASVGLVLGPIVAGILLPNVGWSGAIYVWILFGVAVWPFLYRLDIKPASSRIQHVVKTRLGEAHWSFKAPFLAAILFMGMTSIDMGLISFIPVYLTDIFNLDVSFVAMILGASKVSGIFTKVIGGVLSDRFGGINILTFVSVASVILALLISYTPSITFLIGALFAHAAVVAIFYPVIFATISDYAPPEAVSKQIGLVVALGSLVGLGLTPAVIGILAQAFGYGVGFAYPLSLGTLGCISILLLRREVAGIAFQPSR